MKKKSLDIKNKLINNITLDGKKKTSEKILLKSLKELQKSSKKQSKELVKLALVQSTPVFKLHRISNKKLKKKIDGLEKFLHLSQKCLHELR